MISVADLKAELGVPEDPGIDSVLTSLETRALDLLQRETGRHFGASQAFTEYLTGDNSVALQLPEDPSAITTVKYRTYVGESWTSILSSDDDGWELRRSSDRGITGARLLRKSSYVWTSGYEFEVVYSFGYTAGAEPGEIRTAVIKVVEFLYLERGRAGLRTESVGDLYSYSTMVDVAGKRDIITAIPGLEDVVNRWRRVGYA